jgi:Ni,Fe-hydrogenase III small subunit/ferredoxin
MPWVFRGLRDGVVTSRYPRRADGYADAFPAAISAGPGVEVDPAICPTGAITVDDRIRVDRGRCILCGRCVRARPDVFAWAAGSETARISRRALVVPELPDDDGALGELRAALAARVRAFGRSIHIRHVDAGSDGADEWEVAALSNPVYDVHRLGIYFTASPRHADILLVTGAGSRGMTAPLARTYEAMAQPVVVIAAGVDACGGGLVSPSYATTGGIGDLLPVDIWAPGSPATPFTLLHAILLAMGRVS